MFVGKKVIIMRRTKEEAEQTRQNLMRVALTVFNKKGYSNTRLEDIAKAADVTRGAIYHHFGSKAELFKEIALQNKHNLNQIIEKRIDKLNDNPSEALHSLLEAIFNKLENDPFFRDFEELRIKTNMVDDLEPLKQILDEELESGSKKLIDALYNFEKQGKLNKDTNKEALAILVISSLTGLIFMYLRSPGLLNIKENLKDITEILFAKIGN